MHIRMPLAISKEYSPDMSPDSEEVVIGCERPEEMREIAKNWNKQIVERCAEQFQSLEKAASDRVTVQFRNICDH